MWGRARHKEMPYVGQSQHRKIPYVGQSQAQRNAIDGKSQAQRNTMYGEEPAQIIRFGLSPLTSSIVQGNTEIQWRFEKGGGGLELYPWASVSRVELAVYAPGHLWGH